MVPRNLVVLIRVLSELPVLVFLLNLYPSKSIGSSAGLNNSINSSLLFAPESWISLITICGPEVALAGFSKARKPSAFVAIRLAIRNFFIGFLLIINPARILTKKTVINSYYGNKSFV